MTFDDLRARLFDLVAFQCTLVTLRGVGADASEEMLWQTFLGSLVEQYGFHYACYARPQGGGYEPAVTVPPGDFAVSHGPGVTDLPVWMEGRMEGRLLVGGGEPASPARSGQLGILLAEAAGMLEARRFRVRTEDELKRARLDAEAATRAKSLLLANMSHEIRTPMAGVLGFADLLASTQLSEQQREYVETIRASGRALLELINDILDFSKVEAGKLRIEKAPVDLRRIVEQAVGLLALQAAQKRLRLHFSVSPLMPRTVLADGGRIRQVLVNLLGNAVKFTEAGEVELRVSAATREDGSVGLAFIVRDTGPGIPVSEQERIFESFNQLDSSTTRKYGGTGLGLAISRMLAEAMGGCLRVESQPGCGATFFFTVPVEPAAARSGGPASDAGAVRLPALNIIVAEDNPVTSRLAVAMLRRLGYDADLARDGSELLDRLHTKAYDVVFMDLHMPIVDGLEATRRIRRDWPANRQPRIVAMTAAAFAEDRAQCLAAGMDDYVSKPVGTAELREALVRLVTRSCAAS